MREAQAFGAQVAQHFDKTVSHAAAVVHGSPRGLAVESAIHHALPSGNAEQIPCAFSPEFAIGPGKAQTLSMAPPAQRVAKRRKIPVMIE